MFFSCKAVRVTTQKPCKVLINSLREKYFWMCLEYSFVFLWISGGGNTIFASEILMPVGFSEKQAGTAASDGLFPNTGNFGIFNF